MTHQAQNYIVVNYKSNSIVKSIWILWNAEDRFLSPRLKNSNARSINRKSAAGNIEVIFKSQNRFLLISVALTPP